MQMQLFSQRSRIPKGSTLLSIVEERTARLPAASAPSPDLKVPTSAALIAAQSSRYTPPQALLQAMACSPRGRRCCSGHLDSKAHQHRTSPRLSWALARVTRTSLDCGSSCVALVAACTASQARPNSLRTCALSSCRCPLSGSCCRARSQQLSALAQRPSLACVWPSS